MIFRLACLLDSLRRLKKTTPVSGTQPRPWPRHFGRDAQASEVVTASPGHSHEQAKERTTGGKSQFKDDGGPHPPLSRNGRLFFVEVKTFTMSSTLLHL